MSEEPKKRNRVRGRTRVAWSIWLTVTWILLVSVWASTLIALAGRPERELGAGTASMVLLTVMALLNALVLVAYVPVTRVASAALGTPSLQLAFKIPWLKPARTVRSLARLRERVANDIADTRSHAHDALMSLADVTIYCSWAERKEKMLREAVQEDPGSERSRLASRTLSRLADLDLETQRRRAEDWYRQSRSFEQRAVEAQTQLEQIDRKIRKLVLKGDKNRDRDIRRLLARAAQT